MLLDPGPLGLHSSIIWKPSIAAIAEPFLSAIAAITAIVAIIWKPSLRPCLHGVGDPGLVG